MTSKPVTIRAALQHVVDYPMPLNDEIINQPVHEMVARTLFDIANRPDASVRGSMARANKARKLILDRLEGKRRPGTRPAAKAVRDLEFVDLTGGEISGAEADQGVQRPDDEPD
jgi:hypothetical protein